MANIVRRYGRAKFGQGLYGYDDPTSAMFGLSIDFANSGAFTGRNDAIRFQNFTIERGRRHWIKPDGKGFEEEMTGRMSAVVADPDQLYNPYGGGPLDLGTNRQMQLVVRSPDGGIYPLFTGTLTDLKFRDDIIPTAQFEASDGWDFLRSRSEDVLIPLQENIQTRAAIVQILDAIDWRWGYRQPTYGSGLYAERWIPYWWMEGGNVAKEIANLIFAELGRVCILGDGSLKHEAKTQSLPVIATIGDADIENGSLEFSAPWETQRNSVTVVTHPRTESAESTIWQSGEAIKVEGYQSHTMTVEFKYEGETVPAKSIVDPVPGTDYQANTLEDGSGTDVTSNFVVVIIPSGNEATMTIYNNGGAAGYLLAGAKVRGVAVYELPEISTSSSRVPGKADKVEFVLESFAYQTVDYALMDAELLVENLTLGRPYISFVLNPNPNLQFKIELGTQLELQFSKLGGAVVYSRVSYIKHEFRQIDNATRTTIYTEPVLLGLVL